jgi:hypothetical protein
VAMLMGDTLFAKLEQQPFSNNIEYDFDSFLPLWIFFDTNLITSTVFYHFGNFLFTFYHLGNFFGTKFTTLAIL